MQNGVVSLQKATGVKFLLTPPRAGTRWGGPMRFRITPSVAFLAAVLAARADDYRRASLFERAPFGDATKTGSTPGAYELRYVLNAPVSGLRVLARRPVVVE